MKTLKETTTFSQHNLGITDREVRVLVGAGMIAAVMFYSPTPIGLWSVLALAAVPFVITGMIGWDPLYTLLGLNTDKQQDEQIHQRGWKLGNVGMFDRVIRIALGAGLIGFTMSGTFTGVEVIAALVAVPLIVTALIAWDPLYAMIDINTFASRHDVELANAELREETVAKLYDFPTSVSVNNTDTYGKAA
jgi:hypothetical protein